MGCHQGLLHVRVQAAEGVKPCARVRLPPRRLAGVERALALLAQGPWRIRPGRVPPGSISMFCMARSLLRCCSSIMLGLRAISSDCRKRAGSFNRLASSGLRCASACISGLAIIMVRISSGLLIIIYMRASPHDDPAPLLRARDRRLRRRTFGAWNHARSQRPHAVHPSRGC